MALKKNLDVTIHEAFLEEILRGNWLPGQALNLDELAERLTPLGFYRVHKGFLVNFAHVSQLSSKGLTVAGELIPISRSKTAEVKLAYMDFLSKKNAVMM